MGARQSWEPYPHQPGVITSNALHPYLPSRSEPNFDGICARAPGKPIFSSPTPLSGTANNRAKQLDIHVRRRPAFIMAPLLKNRVYLGETTHKGNSYPGEHKGIVARELFDAVEERLASSRRRTLGKPSVPLERPSPG